MSATLPAAALALLLSTGSSLEAETSAWHQRRLTRLQAEDGWLSLVGLAWLKEGDNVAGSRRGSAVLLPPSAPERLGVFVRTGGRVSFAPAGEGLVERDGAPFTGGVLNPDTSDKPDILRHGTVSMVVITRGERVGVRVRDSEAKTRKSFAGIERFPVNPAWRKVARFEAAGPLETLDVPDVIGGVTRTPLAGSLTFEHEGAAYRLRATREGDALFVVFADLTNKQETYGAGRFLYAELPRDGQVVLDFNQAYNPPCAFTAFATCPLPVKANRLRVRVEAGERRYGRPH